MPNVKAIIARIERERAQGKERQTILSNKVVATPISRRTTPKPPRPVTPGRRAAAKAAAKASEAPAPETKSKTKTDKPAEPAEGSVE